MTLTHRLLVILGRLAVLAVILLGAEIGVRSGVLSELFFSSPSLIFKALLTQWQNGSFLQDAGITVLETLLGLVSGSLLGMAVGLLLPQLRLVSHVFEPFLMVLNGIPVIVIAPLFILWLGLGILSKIGISIYIVFFAMFIPVYTASLRLDTTFVDALHVMGASRSDFLESDRAVVAAERLYRTQDRLGTGADRRRHRRVCRLALRPRPHDPLCVRHARHADALSRHHHARRLCRSLELCHRRARPGAGALPLFRRKMI